MNYQLKQMIKVDCLNKAKTSVMCIALMTVLTSPNIQAYVSIEPPVIKKKNVRLDVTSMFSFHTTASLHSDLRWRGITLTRQQPGLATNSTMSFNRGRFSNFVTINGFSYTMGPPATQTADSYSDIAYLMTESKLGTKIIIGDPQTSTMSFSITHGIFNWPGGNTWQYTDQTCTSGGTSSLYITRSSHIKPIKTTDVTLNWGDFIVYYSMSDSDYGDDDSSNDNQAPSTKIWEDYLHIKTAKRGFAKNYTHNIEYGYLKHTGRHIDFNINYAFSKVLTGTLKSYNFKSYTTNFANSYGAVGIMQYKFL